MMHIFIYVCVHVYVHKHTHMETAESFCCTEENFCCRWECVWQEDWLIEGFVTFSHTHVNAHVHIFTHTILCMQVGRRMARMLASRRFCYIFTEYTTHIHMYMYIYSHFYACRWEGEWHDGRPLEGFVTFSDSLRAEGVKPRDAQHLSNDMTLQALLVSVCVCM
jgi:hypothetical protein